MATPTKWGCASMERRSTRRSESGRIALVLALEGCPAIDVDVELFETMYRLGVRIASFTHFGRTALADGSGEDGTGGRLTRAGVAAFAEMERLGMLFDVSHLGAASVEHVLELATRPVIATHSSARRSATTTATSPTPSSRASPPGVGSSASTSTPASSTSRSTPSIASSTTSSTSPRSPASIASASAPTSSRGSRT